MRRILDATGTWQFVVAMAVPSMLLTTYIAFQNEPTAIASLAFFAFVWGGMALATGRWLRQANAATMSAVRGWEEQEALTLDLTHLLGESLDHLSTWDRETSDDIAARTNTVIRLRFQTFNERNHP